MQTKNIALPNSDQDTLINLYGPLDENIKFLEKELKIKIFARGHKFKINGPNSKINLAAKILQELHQDAKLKMQINNQHIHAKILSLDPALHNLNKKQQNKNSAHKTTTESECFITKKKVITLRGNQKQLFQKFKTKDINFIIGPAGTGKTFLAAAFAAQELERGHISRITLVRPAIEAGEKLGFLPGTLTEKINPYLMPLYDSLYEVLGIENVNKYIENGTIEIAPLAYMRGRTLNDSIIILDEGQNTSQMQMKMFLTRLGFNSKAIITGDISQIDLATKSSSGLVDAANLLKTMPDIGFTFLTNQDVCRHPLLTKILEAYDKKTDKPDE